MTEKTDTKNITQTIPNNNKYLTTFGGYIYFSDFETDYRGKDQLSSSIAGRIISDWNFDKRCRLNREDMKRKKNYKKGDK